MAKLSGFFLVLGAIQLGLLLYVGPSATVTSLWEMWSNPTHWSATGFIVGFLAVASMAMAISWITTGSVFGFKTDFMFFALSIGGLLGFVVIIVQLYDKMESELVPAFGCPPIGSVGFSCPTVDWILWLCVSPLAVYYAFTVIDWWRGKDI